MDGRSKIHNLPEDIVNSILLKLPVKSLSRFKSCCKSWNCCIDDSDFIKSHLHKSSVDINRQKIMFVTLYPEAEGRARQFKIVSTEASIRADSKVVHLKEPNNIPGLFSNYFDLRVFSCSGLVFMMGYYPAIIMTLWNPAIGKYKLIPNSILMGQTTIPFLVNRVFGFAYDFVNQDYKVIYLHPYKNPRFIVEVYSVKNQCWRIIDNISLVPADLELTYLYNGQVSLNGVIHRLSHKKGAEYKIISFHVADEKFIVTPLPSTCGENPEIHAWEDRLCVFTTIGKEIFIWSLEKDRKTALLTLNYINKFSGLFSLIKTSSWSVGNVLCVKENGNILWRMYEDSFIEYDLRKNENTKFKPPTHVPKVISVNKALYVESLVSLKISWD